MAAKRAAKAKTVDVTFTLPAEVQADSVALCAEFNEWSADGIKLDRDGDGSWRASVALRPGQRYRYRFLLDGERWENAWQADGYVPNPYGSDDSVILVELTGSNRTEVTGSNRTEPTGSKRTRQPRPAKAP